MTRFYNLIVGLAVIAGSSGQPVTGESEGYGLDCSFPIHSKELKCGNLLGDRQKVYDKYMDGCRERYGSQSCDEYEDERIQMSVRQPQSMVNYTSTGFTKIKAPESLFSLLMTHYELNRDSMKEEVWGKGNIYVNHWEAPTYMLSVEDTSLRGGGLPLKNAIWDAVKPVIEEWTGMEQQPSSMYGIRAYTEGAILNPHVDRLPLVSSCIVNVAQENLEIDWPLEVYDRHDRAVNVTMKPGDMVLYESGTLMHGRPFPLKGKDALYFNVFIHFQPTGRPLNYQGGDFDEDSLDNELPPYILLNSPMVANWKKRNPSGWKRPSPSAAQVDTLLAGHKAAIHNDAAELERLAAEDQRLLHAKDRNGWQPIHEAARAGHKDAIEFLIKQGADVNSRTHNGAGVTPLNIAINAHSEDHPVSQYLLGLGAVNLGPEL